jgi:hypothetical protein
MSENAPETPGGEDRRDPRFAHPKARPDDARGAPRGHFGNPAFVPTDDQRAKVRTLAKAFPPAAEHFIARLIGIERTTLRKYFADDLELGRAEMLAAVASQFINRALDAAAPTAKGDSDAQKFILARLAHWSSKVEMTGRDGGPIETIDLSRLNAEQLAAYGRLAAIASGVDPDTIVAVPIDGRDGGSGVGPAG